MAKPNEPAEPMYYVDACAVKHVVDTRENPERTKVMVALFEAAKAKKCRLVTSLLTVAEVAYAAHEKLGKRLDAEVEKQLNKIFHPASPLQLVSVHEAIVRRAQRMLRDWAGQGRGGTGANDIVHLATGTDECVEEFFTFDGGLRKWYEQKAVPFKVCEPHSPPEPQTEGDLFAPKKEDQQEAGPEAGSPEA